MVCAIADAQMTRRRRQERLQMFWKARRPVSEESRCDCGGEEEGDGKFVLRCAGALCAVFENECGVDSGIWRHVLLFLVLRTISIIRMDGKRLRS